MDGSTPHIPRDFEPLPPYTDPRSALRQVLPALKPAAAISVTESAERNMRVKVGDQWQPFRRDVAPYMVEPTDIIASRAFRGLAFCGASQSSKTLSLIQAPLAHMIGSDPGRVAIFQMSQGAAKTFEQEKIAPMIRNSPELRVRQAKGRGSDNIGQKLFIGGTHLTLDWPVITKLSSVTIRWVLATDYDHFPESIDGEGDAYTLMRARARTLMSRGMVVVESSPGAPITDEDWKPKTLHDSPPVKYGVLGLYPTGTRGRLYWPCPHCAARFEPRFDRLNYPASADPAEAGEAAEMECPHCGVLIAHALKRELNAESRWLHESADGESAVPIDHVDLRKTDLASYWMDGAAAAFSSWAELVQQYETALRVFEATGDEEKLKSAMNTGQGRPYFPRSAKAENEISLQGLKDKQPGSETPKGVAPGWTRFVLVSVDTQKTYWDVGVTAFGPDGRHQPIDRFEIHTPPADAPREDGERTVKPFEIAEDWDALVRLEDMAWPVEGESYALRAQAIAVDMQGGGATTENAYSFYRGRRKAGRAKLWWLTRGEPGKHADRVWLKAPERVSATARRGRKAATDIKILYMATDRLKDAVSASLRMVELGQNHCGVPGWMSEPQLLEVTAERRTAKGWEKRQGFVRNESLDHLVQARALFIWLKGEKVEWDTPQYGWAAAGPLNDNAVLVSAAPEGESAQATPPRPKPPRAAPTRIKYLRR